MTRVEQFEACRVEYLRALEALTIARDLYKKAKFALRPGEVRPGEFNIFLRRGRRGLYKPATIETPITLRPTPQTILFTNNKSARVVEFKIDESAGDVFVFVTIERRKRPVKRDRET